MRRNSWRIMFTSMWTIFQGCWIYMEEPTKQKRYTLDDGEVSFVVQCTMWFNSRLLSAFLIRDSVVVSRSSLHNLFFRSIVSSFLIHLGVDFYWATVTSSLTTIPGSWSFLSIFCHPLAFYLTAMSWKLKKALLLSSIINVHNNYIFMFKQPLKGFPTLFCFVSKWLLSIFFIHSKVYNWIRESLDDF
jgi:hypothetical protein